MKIEYTLYISHNAGNEVPFSFRNMQITGKSTLSTLPVNSESHIQIYVQQEPIINIHLSVRSIKTYA